MNPIRLPKPTEPIANPNGTVTKVWLDYLRGIADSGSLEALQQAIQAANEAIAQLQQSGGIPADTKILGGLSVNVEGILANGVVVLSLVNDQSAPEPSTAYGANPDGVKGFYPVSDTIDAVSGETTKTVGADGVTAIGLADLTPTSGGSLQKTSFDGKGRRTQQQAATTTDLPEGSNLYYTNARAQSVSDSAVAAHVAQPDPHPQYQLESGLGSAAFQPSSAFATAAQGAKADTALQSVPAASAQPWTPYTVATLPSVTPAYRSIYVTDLTGNPGPCYSDGTNWRRYSDDSIAS